MSDAPLAGAAWLTAPASVAILEALAGDGAETRFVGGAVRDALAGRPVADVDLATTLQPTETQDRLRRAGLKPVPTGLAHGTVTAVVDGHGYEVTTLRRDVATDGRHAEVVFTDDWRADAARRDFTINAMSADASGRVYDYFGGRADLAAGVVRFVGAASERVHEDYLRILRFFRFQAWYGAGAIDAEGLAACRDGAAGLGRVSAERARVELLRLLAAPDPRAVLAAMAETGVLAVLLGGPPASIDDLIRAEVASGRPPDPILRLAALSPESGTSLGEKLRLSRSESQALDNLRPPWTGLGDDPAGWRKALHRMGPETFRRRALLAAAAAERPADLPAQLAAAAAWRTRRLPIKGRDLIKAGLTRGPSVGAMLAELEDYWIDRDFAPSREDLLDCAKKRIERGGTGP